MVRTTLLMVAILTVGQLTPADAEVQNVLFIVSDDLKSDVLGCYGNTIAHTPHIDRLANSGMLFHHTYCQGAWCAPSRQSLMHSRYQGQDGINLGEHLQKHSIYTARVGKIYHMRVPGDIIDGTDGLDIPSTWTQKFNIWGLEAHTPGSYACLNLNTFSEQLEGRESTKMKNRMFVTVKIDGDGHHQPDYKAATKAIELLAKHKDERFFLAVGFVRPHYPMVAPEKYFDLYPLEKIALPYVPEDDLQDIPQAGRSGSNNRQSGIGQYPENIARMWQGYYASVTFVDDQIGRLVAALEELGIAEKTAIVFTSDHGYHLGEHTFWQKSNLHENVTKVPCIIKVPGLKSGETHSLTELVDLYPTICDLMQIDIPETVQGKSLVPVLNDSAAKVRESALTLHQGYSLRTERWTYNRHHDFSVELYDMLNDPNQYDNLASDTTSAQTMELLDEQLNERLKQHGLTKWTERNKRRSRTND